MAILIACMADTYTTPPTRQIKSRRSESRSVVRRPRLSATPDYRTAPEAATMRTFGRGVRVIQAYRQSDSDLLEPEELASALTVMVDADLTEYDTARSYSREHILGAAVASLPPEVAARLTISTKTSPVNPDGGGPGGFSRKAVLRQGDLSREQLQLDQVLVCYLHSPDAETDLDETLAGMDELYRQGFFQEFGISNFPAWQVQSSKHCNCDCMTLHVRRASVSRWPQPHRWCVAWWCLSTVYR
jgi:aryl-alcohol dehydrogenase-like predicted oxidoreductase